MSDQMFVSAFRLLGVVIICFVIFIAVHFSTYPGLLPWSDRLRERVMNINLCIVIGVTMTAMLAMGIAMVIEP